MPRKKLPPDPPRYLLPAGCKDLGDVLKAARQAGTPPTGSQTRPSRTLQRVVPLCLLGEYLEACLQAARDAVHADGLFFIELSPEDFLGLWTENLVVFLRRPEWCADLERVQEVVTEHGLLLLRKASAPGADTQFHYRAASDDPAALARAVMAVLEDGFCLPSDLPIKFLTNEA